MPIHGQSPPDAKDLRSAGFMLSGCDHAATVLRFARLRCCCAVLRRAALRAAAMLLRPCCAVLCFARLR
ncbi:MAG: hypothetical protein FWH33_06810 [Oscillospiraceae bacterium]|nr:hypothetical protein [Oscillospiraceae bacterium]